MRIDLHHHHHPAPAPPGGGPSDISAAVLACLQRINVYQEKIMATLTDISLAIQEQRTVEQGVVALLQLLSARLAEAIKSADPAALQDLLGLLTTNTKQLSDAVLANTPSAIGSATTTTPVPVPVDTPPVDEPAPVDEPPAA